MDTKKLREIAEWYDTTRTDAGYLFSGERGEASRAWHRAVTTQSILALLDENDSLRAEVERLRALTLNPGATLHGSTIMEIADERNHLRQQLAAARSRRWSPCAERRERSARGVPPPPPSAATSSATVQPRVPHRARRRIAYSLPPSFPMERRAAMRCL